MFSFWLFDKKSLFKSGIFDKKSLFARRIRENMRLCAIKGSIPICCRDGYQTAIILRQQTTWIQIPDTGRIVKTAFCDKLAKKPGILGVGNLTAHGYIFFTILIKERPNHSDMRVQIIDELFRKQNLTVLIPFLLILSLSETV